MCRPWPAPTMVIRAWSSAGGGAVEHARHQRWNPSQGVSQLRTVRIAFGHDGRAGDVTVSVPSLSGRALRPAAAVAQRGDYFRPSAMHHSSRRGSAR